MNTPVGYAQLDDGWDVPVDQALEVDFRCWAGRSKAQAATLTAATAYLRQADELVNADEIDLGAGLAIAGGVIQLRVPEATMRSLVEGADYDFELKFTANGSTRQIRVRWRARKGLS